MKLSGPHPSLLWIYGCALLIYPRHLRFAYRDQMLQALRDSYRDRNIGSLRFWLRAYRDLLESSALERIYMVRNSASQRPLISYALALAVALSLLGGSAAFVISQMMRNGAGNQPQIDMADSYAREIAAGKDPYTVIPSGKVDLSNSLEAFVIFYDDQGRPVKGTGYLDQKLPAPPSGIFDFVRKQGYEKVTWQPQYGVRLASVIKRVDGPHRGFVLAARSLRLVEEEKSIVWRMALGIWIVVMLLLWGGTSLLRRMQPAENAAV